jgi:hypothetical protein
MPEFKSTPIFREYLFWRDTGDPSVFTYILTFLRFGKKVEFIDETLSQSALRAWEGVEEPWLASTSVGLTLSR